MLAGRVTVPTKPLSDPPVTGKCNTEKSLPDPVTWEELALRASFHPATLAALCNVSLRTLERHFQKEYHHTVRDWLRALRVHCAYDAIERGQSIKEAAYNSGFKQPSHLTREFKRHFGICPKLIALQRQQAALNHSFALPYAVRI